MIASPRSVASIAFIMGAFTILLLTNSHLPYSSIQSYFQQSDILRRNQSESQRKFTESNSTEMPSQRISSCNLYTGKWIPDLRGPLYSNSCPVIAEHQNCKGNGRPDRDYENWRWKPDHCELPRFSAKRFLTLMRNKTLVFVADSLARNQMESMLCLLLQEDSSAKNRGYICSYQKMVLRIRVSQPTSTIVARIWSSWLVDTTDEPLGVSPKGIVKVHLDVPDKSLMEFLPKCDVVVLSSGHWFAKQSAYVLNNTAVGGQRWWPKEAGEMKINNTDAFAISVETVLNAIASHPKFKGLVIVRSYSPSHYEGGAWNTGGSCTGQVQPATEVARDGYTDKMHDMQVKAFHRVVERQKDGGAKLRLMDITAMFGHRRDGDPGPYRLEGKDNATERRPNGEKAKAAPQDCLHWCMPGAVDTWNEILLEIISRLFDER